MWDGFLPRDAFAVQPVDQDGYYVGCRVEFRGFDFLVNFEDTQLGPVHLAGTEREIQPRYRVASITNQAGSVEIRFRWT